MSSSRLLSVAFVVDTAAGKVRWNVSMCEEGDADAALADAYVEERGFVQLLTCLLHLSRACS